MSWSLNSSLCVAIWAGFLGVLLEPSNANLYQNAKNCKQNNATVMRVCLYVRVCVSLGDHLDGRWVVVVDARFVWGNGEQTVEDELTTAEHL